MVTHLDKKIIGKKYGLNQISLPILNIPIYSLLKYSNKTGFINLLANKK